MSYEDALGSGDGRVRLNARVLGAVLAVVAADVATIATVSRRGSVSEAIVARSPRAGIAVADASRMWLSDAADLGPLLLREAEQSNANVLRLAEMPPKAPPGYLESRRAIGVRDEAAMYLRVSGTIVAVVALLRAAGGPGFSRLEALALRRVQPLVEQAYACAAQPAHERAFEGLSERGLTAREVEVAALVGEGATNAQIARSLHLGQATVKTHLSRIYAKLGVRTRTELALLVRGRRRGFERSSVRPSTTFG